MPPLPSAAQEPLSSAPTYAEPQQEPAQNVAYWHGDQDDSITWTASEFISHAKNPGWHVLVVSGAIVIALIAWLFTRDIVSALVVVLAGAALSVYGNHKPQQLQYQLDTQGLSIGQKHFDFDQFRAFSVVPEGAFSSIALLPTKRFSPLISLYYDPEDEEKIFTILGMHLPHQERSADMLDALMRHIRF
jgi:hypothetical protein